MNLELFIAKRIHFSKDNKKRKVSTPSIRIATTGIAIGIAAMILSVAIAIGFKKEVRNKVVGFGGHIQIENYNNTSAHENLPIVIDDSLINTLENFKGVEHVERYTKREGIIKIEDNFQGVLFKGVSDDFNWDFFRHNLVEGDVINTNDSIGNQVLISRNIANKLHLNLNDEFLAYFIKEQTQARKFVIVGIYDTNFENYDKLYVITNQKLLQRLNKWDKDQVTGLELFVDDFDNLDEIKQNVFFDMITYKDKAGSILYARSIKDIAPHIFNWLDLLDTNVWVIIILMIIVSGFTMVSGLLIIILERTNMIGILKAMGLSNRRIRKTFLYISSFLILKGMLIGNAIAFGVILLQKIFGIVKLDPNTYYVSEMPIDINIIYIVLINIGCLLVSLLMMIGPSYLIARISPAKSIKFE